MLGEDLSFWLVYYSLHQVIPITAAIFMMYTGNILSCFWQYYPMPSSTCRPIALFMKAVSKPCTC